MKKLFIMVLSVLFFAPAVFADNWGAGIKLGVGQNDPESLNDIYDYIGGKLTEGNGIFGLEVLHEWELNNDLDKIGVKLGIDIYGENELKSYPYRITETIYAFPLTAYYKQEYGIERWSWFAGAGLTFMKGEIEDGPETYKDSQVFPHIVAGAEYRFTKLFALGFEAKYNIGAKLKKGNYKTDRSGISGALTARFYF
ncbi:MAG: porin family protein [Elusimicrobiaceae bacterium]|nr:porin family protein [Elusimicrobiaceae bacterium]